MRIAKKHMQKRGLQLLLTLGWVILLSEMGFADACPTATYDKYLNLPITGCNLDDKTFLGFKYSSTSNPGGLGLPADSVMVTPITTKLNPGFKFNATWFASNKSGIRSMGSNIEYLVSVNPDGAPITDLTLSIGSVGWTGTGAVIVNETACLGGFFPDCPANDVVKLNVFDSSAGTKLFAKADFDGVTEVDIQEGIQLQAGAGANGTASLSLVTNQFSETPAPEPNSLMLFGVGTLSLAGMLRRRLAG